MEKTKLEKIRLGIFVILAMLIFILAIYFIGNKQQMFGKTDHLETVFNNVNGLQLGNNVRYSGINAGTVREITMINDTTIRVDMLLEKKIMSHIKKDAIATIGSDGLVGNMIINIIPSKGNTSFVQPGDEIRSLNRIRTEDLLKTFSVTNNNAAYLTSNLLKITDTIIKGKGTLSVLLNDIEMSKDIKETILYLKSTVKSANESVIKVNKLITSLDNKNNVIGVVKDSAVANKIKNMIQNLDKSSVEIDQLIKNLNATVLNVKEGKGAINYLSNNPKLVQKIDSTMKNINESSSKLNENLEALKHNFLFRGYFRRLEKAREREAKK